MFEGLEEKLAKINADKYAEASKADILFWRERLPKLVENADWLKHPTTKALVQEFREQLKRIDMMLCNNPEIPEGQRMLLFAEKSALKFFLSNMPQDPEAEAKQIEESVDKEIEEGPDQGTGIQ